MSIHFLDIIIYFILAIAILQLLPDELTCDFTWELGSIVGTFIIIVYTIIYIYLFAVVDYNWMDIFSSINIKWKL